MATYIVLVWDDQPAEVTTHSQAPLKNDLALDVAGGTWKGNFFNENMTGADDGYSYRFSVGAWAHDTINNRTSKILRMTLGGTRITGPCTPSDTILCIDDAPGDRRFQVEIEYETEQAGGMSGHGRAVPLSSLGVARGGLFWFFGADNPEIIVKILNGCASNQKYWVFISGGTNVGMIITVSDTVTGEVHTYYNRDLTPFAPIQDTRALSCSVP